MKAITTLILLALSTTAYAAYMGSARDFGIVAIQNGHSTATVTFIWDASDPSENVDGYNFYCKGRENISGQTTEPTYTVEMRHGVYECWVTAYRGDEESVPSKIITVKVK
jgi:hypothetical protein